MEYKRRLSQKYGDLLSHPWKCKRCPEKFSRYKLWAAHQRNHPPKVVNEIIITNGEEKKKTDPSQTEIQDDSFQKHITRTEFQDKIVNVCNICFMVFKEMSQAKDHVGTHTDEDCYQCQNCQKNFKLIESLEYHKLSCPSPKKMKIEQNGIDEENSTSRGSTIESMTVDIKEEVGEDEEEKIEHPKSPGVPAKKKSGLTCEQCPQVFPFLSMLKRHVQRHHNPDRKRLTTKGISSIRRGGGGRGGKTNNRGGIIPRMTRRPSNPIQYFKYKEEEEEEEEVEQEKEEEEEEMMEEEVPTVAEQVEIPRMIVERTSTSKEHISRVGDRGTSGHQCNICQRIFPTTVQAINHVRVHTGETPYQCSACSRKFSQRANCLRHIRIHTGERPYVCSVCSRSFGDSGSLKSHIDHIHGNKKKMKIRTKAVVIPKSPVRRTRVRANNLVSRQQRLTTRLDSGSSSSPGPSTKTSKQLAYSISCTVSNRKIFYVCDFCTDVMDERLQIMKLHQDTCPMRFQ